ncbi:VOC family protein [Saccharopolyspora shandongensis]|uniref:VOC family protein n=1 Tax=Saccharopolyspora shandongensis TaxID=418495 RepID=UPI003F4D57F8
MRWTAPTRSRWTCRPWPGSPTCRRPGAPSLSEETAQEVRELVTKGAMGGWFILTTDDCHKTYETLLARGVEFTEEPTERPYGIDCGLRDPFGNRLRFTELRA